MALWQLILTELRQFWREPGALFWTLVFPLGLAGALGLGFSNRSEPTYAIGIEAGEMPPFLQTIQQVPQSKFTIRQNEQAGRTNRYQARRNSVICRQRQQRHFRLLL